VSFSGHDSPPLAEELLPEAMLKAEKARTQ
jgi:hypothetical protein